MTADSGLNRNDDLSWSVENEIHLFDALTGYKPVGVNKHFLMLPILEKFCDLTQKEIEASTLWEKLNQLYDMAVLDEMEVVPFPNEPAEFCLPAEEFQTLMQQRQKPAAGGTQRLAADGAAAASPDPVRRSRSYTTDSPTAGRETRRFSDVSDINRRASKRTGNRTASPAGTPPPKRAKRN